MEKGITITRDEAESLHDFISCGFIPFIQECKDEVDNMKWLYHIAIIWKKCDEMLFEEDYEDVKMGKN